MIRKTSEFYDKPVVAVDEGIGKLADFYFDERSWLIRYLVVELGNGFASKKVLISPEAFASFDGGHLKVQLTKDEICRCRDKTSAEQMPDSENAEFIYGPGRSLSGSDQRFKTVLFPPYPFTGDPGNGKGGDPHFRSSRGMKLFRIVTEDFVKGKVDDFLFDDRLWNIRFLLVRPDSGSGEDVQLLVSFLVDTIGWEQKIIHVGCRGDYLMRCPKFEPSVHCNVSYEEFLVRYNGASRKKQHLKWGG